MNSISIPIRKAVKQMTMRVELKGVKVFKARIWIGKQMIRLAALVMGCGIEVEGFRDGE